MVTLSLFVLSLLTLGLILMIDSIIMGTPFLKNAVEALDVGVGEGMYIMYASWLAAFVVAAVNDYRWRKKQRKNQEG